EGKGFAPALRSAPHGAGRRFSRTEARKRFTAEDLDSRMKGIVYRPGKEWIDEIPDAYNDIDQVMEDAAKLVEVKHELRQIVNVKATESTLGSYRVRTRYGLSLRFRTRLSPRGRLLRLRPRTYLVAAWMSR